MRIKEIKVIVVENQSNILTKSSVGIKWKKGKKQYGEFIGFTKPKLTIAEVVEIVNELMEKVVGK